MSYKEDFANADGWSAADVSVRLNNAAGRKLLAHFRAQGVDTLIRYYASSARPKTLTPEEAQFLSAEGFAIVPVFQDRARQIEDFSAAQGEADARSAVAFAKRIGQPQGSTILFAADADFPASAIDGPLLAYFRSLHRALSGQFRMGAYGSGALLAKLRAEGLIEVPWLSMSRLFLGTEGFFYAPGWALRQVPPTLRHEGSGIQYDRNVVRVPRAELGAFQVNAEGQGQLAWAGEDATLDKPFGLTERAAPVALAGANRFVAVDGLRLRREPNGTILRDLTLGEAVQDQGPSNQPGWRQVKVGADEGVAFGAYLREPARPEVEALLRAALDEWLRFEKGQANEKADPYYLFIRQMWAAIGEPFDGRSVDANGDEVAWSAAFISWVVRQAGPAYANFQFSARHSVFVNNAIKARVTQRLDKPFWGFRISEAKPELGDIIQRNRGGNSFSFDFAENHSQYISHSDIVVQVSPHVVRVVGGNVGNTVRLGDGPQEYTLDANGHLAPGQGVIALLKNRAGLA